VSRVAWARRKPPTTRIFKCDGDTPHGVCTAITFGPPDREPDGWTVIPPSAGSADCGEVVLCPSCAEDLEL